MGVVSKYNKGMRFDVDFGEYPFGKLSDIVDATGEIVVKALYITEKGKYGPHGMIAVISSNGNYRISLPSHMTLTVRDMLSDDNVIEAIRHDKVGVEIYRYYKDNNEYIGVNWRDL